LTNFQKHNTYKNGDIIMALPLENVHEQADWLALVAELNANAFTPLAAAQAELAAGQAQLAQHKAENLGGQAQAIVSGDGYVATPKPDVWALERKVAAYQTAVPLAQRQKEDLQTSIASGIVADHAADLTEILDDAESALSSAMTAVTAWNTVRADAWSKGIRRLPDLGNASKQLGEAVQAVKSQATQIRAFIARCVADNPQSHKKGPPCPLGAAPKRGACPVKGGSRVAFWPPGVASMLARTRWPDRPFVYQWTSGQ
jgi:hypothetical protein